MILENTHACNLELNIYASSMAIDKSDEELTSRALAVERCPVYAVWTESDKPGESPFRLRLPYGCSYAGHIIKDATGTYSAIDRFELPPDLIGVGKRLGEAAIALAKKYGAVSHGGIVDLQFELDILAAIVGKDNLELPDDAPDFQYPEDGQFVKASLKQVDARVLEMPLELNQPSF